MTCRNLFFPLFLLLSPTALFSQWENASPAETLELVDVHFWNDSTGIVCGLNKILKTSNGGNSWTTAFNGGSDIVVLEDVETLGDSIAIAVGKNLTSGSSVILRSTDQGNTWVNVPVDDDIFFRDICFINDSVGFSAGGASGVYKTINAGQSWEWLTGQGGFGTQSVFFTDEQTGYLCGGGPGTASMVKTVDGGQTWFPVNVMGENFLQSIYFTDSQTGYVVGWSGGIYKTTDAGNSWTEQLVATMQGNLKVTFTDPQTGYIAGGYGQSGIGSILKTVDAGNTWVETAPAGTRAMISIDFPGDQIGYACGSYGTVLRTSNGGTTSSGYLPLTTVQVNIYPNPVQDVLTVDGVSEALSRLDLYDSSGKMIRSLSCSNTRETVGMASFPAGNYYLVLYHPTGTSVHTVVKIR